MEAKELMIGDWILDKQKKPIQCEIINDNDKCINEVYCQGDIVDEINETDIEPIPITPEILELNAKYDDIDDCYTIGCIQFFRQDEGECWLDCYYGIITFKYVHELQHILRICGLNDLADNLKIK